MISQVDPSFNVIINNDIKNCSIELLIQHYFVEDLIFQYSRQYNNIFIDINGINNMKIVQERYLLSENYKVEFVSINDPNEKDSFYIGDFNSHIHSGYINIYNKDVVLYKSLQVIDDPKDIIAINHIHSNVFLLQKYMPLDGSADQS